MALLDLPLQVLVLRGQVLLLLLVLVLVVRLDPLGQLGPHVAEREVPAALGKAHQARPTLGKARVARARTRAARQRAGRAVSARRADRALLDL